jgi:hypothetical protein
MAMGSQAAVQPNPDKWSSVAGRAESIVKILAGVGLLCYGLGLIVTNTFLTRYGVTDFSLLRGQCVVTGCWTAVLLMAAVLPTLCTAVFMSAPSYDPIILQLVKALVYTVTGLVLAYLVMVPIAVLIVVPGEVSSLYRLNANLPGWNGIVAIMNIVPLGFVLFFPELVRRNRSGLIALFTPFIFLSCFLIGSQTYEVIAPQMGGGRPQHGELYFSSNDQDISLRLKHLTSPYHDHDPDGAITGDMIYAGSDRYAFRVVYCVPSNEPGTGKKSVYKEQVFVADKKTMQSFFLTGLSDRRNGSECPFNRQP